MDYKTIEHKSKELYLDILSIDESDDFLESKLNSFNLMNNIGTENTKCKISFIA